MEIETRFEGTKLILKVFGKILVSNVAVFDKEVDELASSATDFDLDFTNVEYVSSAGLRAIFTLQKAASRHGGTLRLINPNSTVMEMLEMTGLADMLTIVTA